MADRTDSPMRVIELATNLDDVTGEQAGHMIDALMRAGALDAWATPITMKKGRPALMLSALVREDDQAAMTEQVLRLTGSFGVRHRAWDRVVLERQWHERETRLGPIRLKAGSLGGEPISVKPEFEDVVCLSESAGVPLTEAHRACQAAADQLLTELKGQSAGGQA